MKWLEYLSGHKKRMAEYKAQLSEINYRRERLIKAHALHLDVLNNYGLAEYSKLIPVDTIIQDNKPITLINYLDI